MDHLPFLIDELYGGFAEVLGVARIEREGLRLEYETRDTVFHAFRSTIRSLVIPWPEVAYLACSSPRFGGSTLTIRTRGLEAMASLPGRNGAEVQLSIARERREDALDFIALAQSRVAQHGLAEVESRLRNLQAS